MISFRRILVATDFSEASRAALEGAGRLAERLDIDVEVLHVWQPPQGVSIEMPTTGAPHETLSDVVRRAAAHQLSQLLTDYPRKFRQRIEVGTPHELIITLAASDGHDLIVLGRTGTGRTKSSLGSVAERVIAMAPCPVLTLAARASV